MSAGDDATAREREVQELVFAALDLPASERVPFLAAHGANPELRREVEARLRLAEASEPRLGSLLASAEPDSAAPGQTLGGRYRLVRELGSGGMGTVWLAERADGEYRQQVAIKVLRGEAARTRALAGRFRTERQILATLDHPGIAKLLDGGTTPDGTQYLVMEYVDGQRLDEYCRQRALSVRERVALFVEICAAVDAAHQRLVVHRDLKPANIMVTASGSPKLLDFGIAKLQAPETFDGDVGAATEQGRSPLTLRYASPEQVQGAPIGTASDVFSLGVVLFELLAERSPYGERLRSVPSLLRAICDELPPAPSAATGERETSRADAMEGPGAHTPGGRDAGWSAAAPRPGAAPATWSAEAPPSRPLAAARQPATAALRGDLDAIVLKALRKEPTERYPSVAAMAEDLRCYLDGRVVAARQGTQLYRLGKLIRRHRLPIAALVVAFAGVLTAAVVSWLQAHALAAERDRVLAAERQARDEAETARQVTAFLIGVLEPASPEVAQGKAPSLREILDRGAERLESELAGRPTVQAPLLEAIGTIYGDLGAPDRGVPMLERAVALRRARQDTEPLPYAEALSRLARGRRLTGELESAATLSSEALAVRIAHLGPAAEATLDERNRLSVILMELGRYDDAAPLLDNLLDQRLRQAGFAGLPLDLTGRKVGPESEPLARVLHTRGVLAYYTGHFREAADFYQQSAQLGRLVYGTRHTRVATTETAMAVALIDLGEHQRALDLLDDALAIRVGIQGANHPDVAAILINRAAALQPLGRWADVVADSERAERILLASVGPDHPNLSAARNNRAEGLLRLGRVTEALALHREILAELERQHPDGHADLVPSYLNLSTCLGMLGRHAEAVRQAELGSRMARRLLGPGHPTTLEASLHLGRALLAAGRRQAGVSCLEAAIQAAGESHDAISLRSSLRFELARALAGEPAQRRRARELAVAGREDLGAEGRTNPGLAAEIDAWLAAQRESLRARTPR